MRLILLLLLTVSLQARVTVEGIATGVSVAVNMQNLIKGVKAAAHPKQTTKKVTKAVKASMKGKS